MQDFTLSGLEVERLPVDVGLALDGIQIWATDRKRRLDVRLTYSADNLEHGYIEGLLDRLVWQFGHTS